MNQGLKTACWIIAIATVIFCDLSLLILFGMTFAEESGGCFAYIVSDIIMPFITIGIPILELTSVVLGIIAAVNTNPCTLKTTRSIMLLFKLGLIPFFILGTLLELMCFVMGFHPIFVGFGWAIGLVIGALGWLTMMSGSVWGIATAVQMKKQQLISGTELAAHIVLQLLFVADVISAIILFVRSRRSLN